MDQERPGEADEDARAVEEATAGSALAPEPPSAKTVPLSDPEPSNTTFEPDVESELVRRPDEVTLEDLQSVDVAAESRASVSEPSNVQITPLTALDPRSTALEPELASELASPIFRSS